MYFLLVISTQILAQSQDAVEYASFTFVDKEYHFGVIQEGEQVQNIFEFTNTSAMPLVIVNARGNCGCTVPEYPMEPIMPGDTSQIIVRFDSSKKTGRQKKSLLITANTDPEITIVNLIGLVMKDGSSKKVKRTLEEIEAEAFTLSINAETSVLSIDLTAYDSDAASIEIYNSFDQLKIKEENVSLVNVKKVDVSELSAGTYTVSIRMEDKHRITKQFVKL